MHEPAKGQMKADDGQGPCGYFADARLLLEGDNMPSIQSAADIQQSMTALVCFEANTDDDVCVGKHCT